MARRVTLTKRMYAIDGDGTTTRISPHSPDGDWEYYSENKRTGKRVRINMERFIKRMEEIHGETFFDEYVDGTEST